ncbi:MAG: glycoside hydrolase family 76 protein [Tepidisphaeraceae bacterium]
MSVPTTPGADGAPTTAPSSQRAAALDYVAAGREVTDFIRENYLLPKSGLYAHSTTERKPDFMWGDGIWCSALVGAARYDRVRYGPPLSKFFVAMDAHWDHLATIPGYEPAPTRGNGNDKYYDDNAWMVLTFVEAFEVTHEQRYLKRAEETLKFVLSGWDDVGGGGIWWHERHEGDSKNTCSNAPSALACLKVAAHKQGAERQALVDQAIRIVEWTRKNFETKDGLYGDNINLKTGHVARFQLTYNTALMIRSFLALHRATGEAAWLDAAKRSAKASDWFTGEHGAYRDELKWSHLLVEADVELYRFTKEPYLLDRARRNAEYEYHLFQTRRPKELINIASIARTMWLLADTQSSVGQAFWEKVDRRETAPTSKP